LQRASWGLVAGGAFLGAAAVLHALTGYDFGGLSNLGTQAQGDSSVVRLDGPVGIDNNYFAQLLVTALPLALYRAWDGRRLFLRVAALGALILICGVIVWTFSRGGFVASLAALAIAAAMQRFNRRRMLALGLALVLVGLTTPRLYWERIGLTAQYVAAR